MSEMPPLKIGDLEARVPIIQGGMGVGVSLSGLASAVADEGAIGVISSAGIGMLEPDFGKDFKEANARALRKEIRKAKETKGIIGVNIMVALSDYDDHVSISVEISSFQEPGFLSKSRRRSCRVRAKRTGRNLFPSFPQEELQNLSSDTGRSSMVWCQMQ